MSGQRPGTAVDSLEEARARRAAAVEGTRALAESLAKPDPIPEQYLIREPGVYPDIPADIYHRDPVVHGSLSSTGARRLVEDAGPAKYRHAADHPGERRSDALDFGVLAHHLVLGDVDDRIVVMDADEWRTAALKASVAKVRESGRIPVRPKDWATVEAMAKAIDDHPTAAALLRSTGGQPEQTIVWRDRPSGVWCRARLDWFRTRVDGRRLIIVDYKTTTDASADGFAKQAAAYGYHQQADFYLAGVRALGIDEDPAFVFVVQEKDPPHLVNQVELEHTDLVIGRNLNRQALDTYATCRRTGRWPGYGDEIQLVALPGWYRRLYDED